MILVEPCAVDLACMFQLSSRSVRVLFSDHVGKTIRNINIRDRGLDFKWGKHSRMSSNSS